MNKKRAIKEKPVDVSDSDEDENKAKKKRIVKKKLNDIIITVKEADNNEKPSTEEEDYDISSVKTTDFIKPLSISNELEEEDLSDIDDAEI